MGDPYQGGGAANLGQAESQEEAYIPRTYRAMLAEQAKGPKDDSDEAGKAYDDRQEFLTANILTSPARTLDDVVIKLDVTIDRMRPHVEDWGATQDLLGISAARDDLRRLIAW